MNELDRKCLTIALTVTLCITLILLLLSTIKVNPCKHPYQKVCIKHHTETRLVPMPRASGLPGVAIGRTVTMVPRVIKICDQYETRLKEGCTALSK